MSITEAEVIGLINAVLDGRVGQGVTEPLSGRVVAVPDTSRFLLATIGGSDVPVPIWRPGMTPMPEEGDRISIVRGPEGYLVVGAVLDRDPAPVEVTGGGGAPSGAAGGDLSGTYPDPSVTDDSHSHTAATVPTGGAPSGAAGGVLGGTYPNPSFAADMATQAELDAHISDTTDAHDASAISFVPVGTIAGTDAQTAIAEVATDAASALATHEADTTSIHGIANTANLYAAGGTDVALADGGTGASTAAAARTNLGLVIATDVEAHDADLTTIAGLAPTNDDVLQRKAGAWANRTIAQLVTDLGLGSVYQPLDSDLTAIAALTTTSIGRSLLAAADAAAIRTIAGAVIGTNVQAQDAELSAIAGLTSAADSFPYFTGSGTASLLVIASAIRTILAAADASAFRTAAGLAIGTNVQAFDAELAAIAGLTSAADKLIRFTGSGTADLIDGASGTWTPVLTFATPGNLAISGYASQTGRWTRFLNRIFYSLNVQINAAAATWTTASGNLRITGLPVAATAGNLQGLSLCSIRGYAKTNFTQVSIGPVGSQTYMETMASGSGQVPAALIASEFTSGAAISLFASGHYDV